MRLVAVVISFFIFFLTACKTSKTGAPNSADSKLGSAVPNTGSKRKGDSTPATQKENTDATKENKQDSRVRAAKGKQPQKADTTKNITPNTNRLTEQKIRQDTTRNHLTDEAFMIEALQGMMMQIRLARLAKLYAGASDVRKYGAKVVASQTKVSDRLREIMMEKGLNPEDILCGRCDDKYLELSYLLGSSFDSYYLPFVRAEHVRLKPFYSFISEKGDDPRLRSWAKSTLKLLRGQQDDIEAMMVASREDRATSFPRK